MYFYKIKYVYKFVLMVSIKILQPFNVNHVLMAVQHALGLSLLNVIVVKILMGNLFIKIEILKHVVNNFVQLGNTLMQPLLISANFVRPNVFIAKLYLIIVLVHMDVLRIISSMLLLMTVY